MRRAGYESGWHLTQDGDVLGFSLMGDCCTEHEIGVRPLRAALGVPERFERGMTDRVNTKEPPAFRFKTYTHSDGQPAAWLLLGSDSYARRAGDTETLDGWMGREVGFHEPLGSSLRDNPKEAKERSNFAAAWDENGCLVHVRGLGNVQRLQKMAQAVIANDLAFGGALIPKDTGRRAGGLTFVRASKVRADIQAQVLQEDQKEGRLQAAADLVLPQLKNELKTQGKNWFAISPAWKDKNDETQGLMFWLNPYEQQDYHSGWFTEDHLRAWGRNEGPVLRDKELERAQRANQDVLGKIGKAMRRAKIETPWFTTVRAKDNPNVFVVRAFYNQAADQRNGRAPLTRIDEGFYSLKDLWALVPERAPVSKEDRAGQQRASKKNAQQDDGSTAKTPARAKPR